MKETGGAIKGCWAACLGDCDEGISREHRVSKCLFESEEILVQGFPWCLNEPKAIPLANFVAKILYKKHNSALSELDSAALQGFEVFRESICINQVRGRLKRPPIWNVKRLTIDGPRLERWFLKTLINFSYDGQWTIGPGAHPAGTVSRDLVEIVFGRRQFENGAGLYTVARTGEQIDSMDRVGFMPLTLGNNVGAGRFNFRGYTFLLNLFPEKFHWDGASHAMHRKVTHNCFVQERLSHIILIQGWLDDRVIRERQKAGGDGTH
jgi:hypothetical protein